MGDVLQERPGAETSAPGPRWHWYRGPILFEEDGGSEEEPHVSPEVPVPNEWRFEPGDTVYLVDDHTRLYPVEVLEDSGGWFPVRVYYRLEDVEFSVRRGRLVSEAQAEAINSLVGAVSSIYDLAGKVRDLSPDEVLRAAEEIGTAMEAVIRAHGGIAPGDSWAWANVGMAMRALGDLEKQAAKAQKGQKRQEAAPAGGQLKFDF